MMRLPLAGLLPLLLLLPACDGGTGPTPVALVSVYQGSVPTEEVTLVPGSSVTLRATPLSEARSELEDRPVRWASNAPAVATVGETSGVVTAVAVGTALITATSEGVVATVRVNVALPVTDPDPTCADGDPGLGLEVGEVRTFSAFDAVILCLAGGEAGAEFTLVPFNSFSSSNSRMAIELRPNGTIIPTGPPNPSAAPAMLRAGSDPGAPRPDPDFHQRLNDAMQRQRAVALRSAAGPRPSLDLSPSGPSFATVPKVGDQMRLNVQSRGADGCEDPDYRNGVVRVVSARAVVVADVDNPAGGFTDADYQAFAREFDERVWAVDTQTFGEPSDIDDNDRAVIFFTRAVNELTGPTGDGSYVGGFFYNRDLFSRDGDSPCEGSNEREMFYMLVPDPTGTIHGNPRSVSFVQATTVSVLAHEFQHLINDSRRLHVNRAPVWEERWLNEGLSHIAEELMFYDIAGLGPERNLTVGDVAGAQTTRLHFTQYALENVERLISYLEDPAAESTLGDDNLATRGAAWAFLRYAADRKADGDGQDQLWHSLVNSKTAGLDNLRQVLGADPTEWLQDWSVSLYTDDAVPGVHARFTQPSWNFRRLIPGLRFAGIGESRHIVYPLDTTVLTGIQNENLHGGGAAYYRFAVPPDARASVRTTVNGLPAPSRLKLSVVRTK